MSSASDGSQDNSVAYQSATYVKTSAYEGLKQFYAQSMDLDTTEQIRDGVISGFIQLANTDSVSVGKLKDVLKKLGTIDHYIVVPAVSAATQKLVQHGFSAPTLIRLLDATRRNKDVNDTVRAISRRSSVYARPSADGDPTNNPLIAFSPHWRWKTPTGVYVWRQPVREPDRVIHEAINDANGILVGGIFELMADVLEDKKSTWRRATQTDLKRGLRLIDQREVSISSKLRLRCERALALH